MPDGDETMPHVPPEQVARTREMDLLTYLQRHEPDVLVHLNGNTYIPPVPTTALKSPTENGAGLWVEA